MKTAIMIALALLAAVACAPLAHDHPRAPAPKPIAAAAHDDHRHPGMFHAFYERLHKWAHSEDAK